jgi:hypothetical protein
MIAYFLGRPAQMWNRRFATTTPWQGIAPSAPLHEGSQGRLLQTAVAKPSPASPAGCPGARPIGVLTPS